jgi:hypothetical protein
MPGMDGSGHQGVVCIRDALFEQVNAMDEQKLAHGCGVSSIKRSMSPVQ